MIRSIMLLTLISTKMVAFSGEASGEALEDSFTKELCRIGQNYFKDSHKPVPGCHKISSLELAQKTNAAITIGKNTTFFNSKFKDYLRNVRTLNQLIGAPSLQAKEQIKLAYDKQTYKFLAKPIGRGERGTVYPLVGLHQVIKIPKADPKSIRILQEEKASSDFWYKQSQNPNINFSVPKKLIEHPLGLFSIMERVDGLTLTDVLIRFKVMLIAKDLKSVSLNSQEHLSHKQRVSLDKIEQAIMDLVRVFRQSPQFKLSISPNNILITFSDKGMTQVDKVYLIDFGLDSGYHTNYSNMESFEHYLLTARRKIEGYLERYPLQFQI